MHQAHDALLCIDAGQFVRQTDRRKVDKSQYFKSAQQMINLFKDLPEAIENTVNIAKRCSYICRPIEPLLCPNIPTLKGRSESEALHHMTKIGLQHRLDTENSKRCHGYGHKNPLQLSNTQIVWIMNWALFKIWGFLDIF